MNEYLIIISENTDEQLNRKLFDYGEVVKIPAGLSLDKREASHPDMRICRTSENSCVISPDMYDYLSPIFSEFNISFTVGKTVLSEKYPKNIAYNVLVGDKIFFHNIKYTDSVATEILKDAGKKTVNIKQGYAGCSSIFAGEVLVTSDLGVYKIAREENIETILFEEPDKIILEGFDHGFIGGCCGYSSGTGLLINCAPEFLPERFRQDLVRLSVRFSCIGAGQLTDIGGITIFTGHH